MDYYSLKRVYSGQILELIKMCDTNISINNVAMYYDKKSTQVLTHLLIFFFVIII